MTSLRVEAFRGLSWARDTHFVTLKKGFCLLKGALTGSLSNDWRKKSLILPTGEGKATMLTLIRASFLHKACPHLPEPNLKGLLELNQLGRRELHNSL